LGLELLATHPNLPQELAGFQAEKKDRERVIQKLEGEVLELEEEIERLGADALEFADSRDGFHATLLRMESELSSARARNEELEHVLSSTREKDAGMDTAAQDQRRLQKEVAELQADLERLRGTLDEVVTEKDAADQASVSLRKELLKIREQHDAVLEESRHASSQVEDDLLQTLHKTTSERDLAVGREKLLQGELVQIKEKQEAVLDEVHRASAQAKDELMHRLHAVIAERAEANRKWESLQENLNELKAQHEAHLDEACQERDRALVKLEAQKEASEKLTQDYEKGQCWLLSLERETARLSDIDKDRAKIVTELGVLRKQLDAEVRRREETTETIEAKILQKTHRIAELEETLDITKRNLKDDVHLLTVGNDSHHRGIH
jgi:chromosome segregation ATPase